jgi:hypothetical protein
MKKFVGWLTLTLGVLLIIFAWALDYRDTSAVWQDTITGLVIAALSAAVVSGKLKKAQDWLLLSVAVLGLWLIVAGIFVFGTVSASNRVIDIVLGVVILALALVASQVIEGRKGFVFTKDGEVLLEMSRLGFKDGSIEAKGKAYGAMPQTMRIPPEQVWALIGLVPFEVIVRLPKVLFDGWRKSRGAASTAAAAAVETSASKWKKD